MNNLCGKLKCAEYAPPGVLMAETGKGRFLVESRTYYYARVSSREQNLDRQFAAFAALGAQERDIIADKESGKSINRSGYTALKSALLRRGDTLVIKSLDRLSRNKEDTKRELQYFRENGIRLKVLDLPTTMIEYVQEASEYFNIGVNKIRELSNSPDCPFVLWVGNKRLIKRVKFQQYLEQVYSV